MKKIILLAAITLTACGQDPAPTSAPDRAPADLLLHGGTVVTLDDSSTLASAIAVRGGRIVEVGDDNLLQRYQAERTVNLNGRTLLPGFIDTHTHISGNPDHYIELTEVTSVAEIRSLVAAKAEALGPGKWITGYGWSEDELAEGRRPLRLDLDHAAPNNPVVLTRAGAHSAVASSAALDLAGIDAKTPDPEGGVIERDERGELNGIIRERHTLITDLVPPSTRESVRDSLIANLRAQFAHGITSLVQAQDTIDHYAEWEQIYAQHAGTLPRAAVQVMWEGAEAMRAFGRKSGDGDAHLKLGAIKIFVDGGFTGPAAFTTRPYKGEDEYRGKLNLTEAELKQIIEQAHADGWQLGIHAIGDAAIELTVAQLVEVLKRAPREDHRHFLNHFTVMPTEETMRTMAASGIAITQQPNFTYTLEGRYVANLDGQRLETNNPLRTPMDLGIHVAISSDILPIGPAVGLYAATTRKGMSGRVFGPQERISTLEALRGYTVRGAYLTFDEADKGTLEAGKLADLIVLDRNPLDMAPDALRDLSVQQTYLAGRLVFDREDPVEY